MTKNLKLFLTSILLSSVFCWGINLSQKNLENLFYFEKIAKNPQILTAKLISEGIKVLDEDKKELPKEKKIIPEINTRSYISVLIDQNGNEKILFEKESDKKLPIASLTKLMTALVVLEYPEYYSLEDSVRISKEAIAQDENFGGLMLGEKFSIEDLLYVMLIESSNDAAWAISEVVGINQFVNLMNLQADYNLGFKNSYFVNSTGLDPKDPKSQIGNYSTAKDLAKLTKYLLKKSLIWEILSKKEYDLWSEENIFHHLINKNELLDLPEVLGGKTGYTDEALGCFILVLKSDDNFIINVILGSKDRFSDMKKMIETATKN